VATTAGPTPAAGEDSARGVRARVSYFENSLQKSKSYVSAQRSIRINKIRGCERGPNRYNRVCESSMASYRWKGVEDGTLAAKPTKAGQARDIGSTPGGARQASQDVGRRNALFDGSRARSQNGEVFTDHVAQRSRRSFDVWATTEGSASWHIEGARQARQWFDDRRMFIRHPPQSLWRRETAGCSDVRLRTNSASGNRSCPQAWGRDLAKSERDTGARDWSSRWQKPIARITRVVMQRRKAVCVTCALVDGLRG